MKSHRSKSIVLLKDSSARVVMMLEWLQTVTSDGAHEFGFSDLMLNCIIWKNNLVTLTAFA
jgi:hypothetical protein